MLLVSVASQRMTWIEQNREAISWPFLPCPLAWHFSVHLRKTFVISTSRFGMGQTTNSNRTPLGLHRVAAKIGGGHPIGTVFQSRLPVGLTWRGWPNAAIAHRVLWLEGMEPGLNCGGNVDSFRRYIYIHGPGNEPGLGRPASRGCIHLAAADLLPLFDKIPVGTLVWIAER